MPPKLKTYQHLSVAHLFANQFRMSNWLRLTFGNWLMQLRVHQHHPPHHYHHHRRMALSPSLFSKLWPRRASTHKQLTAVIRKTKASVNAKFLTHRENISRIDCEYACTCLKCSLFSGQETKILVCCQGKPHEGRSQHHSTQPWKSNGFCWLPVQRHSVENTDR